MTAPARRRGQAFTLLAASSLTVMAGAVVAPSLPGIEIAFHHLAQAPLLARLVLTIPALAIALSAPFAGYVVDRFGRRGTLSFGLALFALAGCTGLFMQTMGTLLAGRVLLGVGISAIMTAATTLIADLYVGQARGRLLAWQAAFMGLGGTTFLLSGGALADISWRAPFALYLVSLLLVPAVRAWIREPDRTAQGAGDVPASSPPGHREPGVWLPFVTIYGLSFAAMVAFYLIPVQAPFLMTARLEASGLGVGVAIATMAVVSAAGSLLAPRVIDVLGQLGTASLTFATMGGGEILMSRATTWPEVLVAMACAGMGLGIIMPNMALWVTRIAPMRARGRLLGGLSTALFSGQFLSPIVVAPVVAAGPDVGAGRAFLLVGIGCLALAALCLVVAWMSRAHSHGVSRKQSEHGPFPSPPVDDAT